MDIAHWAGGRSHKIKTKVRYCGQGVRNGFPQGMVVHAFHPSIPEAEAEAGESL